MCSCDRSDSDSSTDILKNGAESIVPSRAELIDNTKDAGYTVTEFNDIYDLKVSGERVLAEKDGKFIDICYGLSEDDAKEVFRYYETKYDPQIKSQEYYMLSRNQNFVYFISDKSTFKVSGFKSIDNDGEQYICKE
ncbi:hypothetical protein [Ruminococcus sp.]|uniref:hypothetical protein n=1 Tax=Ruminococcus sp. TaxID=41978 RepID=UPI0025FA1E0F|nr:hypothetical protein [Ruminococcus sp.]